MQSIPTFFEDQPRLSGARLLCWFRTAAWVVVAGAVSPWAHAQAPADSPTAEKIEAASEPQRAAAPETASHTEPGVPAQWNRRRTTAPGPDAQLRRLTADLKLDSAQQAKVKPILVARNDQMHRLQQDTRLTPAERRQRALAIGDQSAEQIRAQLTDAQRALYVQPRVTTTVAQAGPAGRRGGMAASPATAPNKGAKP